MGLVPSKVRPQTAPSLLPSREHTMREEPLPKHAGAWISDVQPPEQ